MKSRGRSGVKRPRAGPIEFHIRASTERRCANASAYSVVIRLDDCYGQAAAPRITAWLLAGHLPPSTHERVGEWNPHGSPARALLRA
jgi:hypothetical protein